MKVLRVIARLNVGGPARHVVLLDRGLQARGYQTLLAHGNVGPGEASLEHLTTEAGIPTLRIPSLGRRVSLFSDVRAFAELIRITFREAPDVIHTHTSKAGALGRAAAFTFNLTRPRHRRCVVVHTFHGHVFDGYFHSIGNQVVRQTERLLARVTDRIIAISPAQRHDLVDRYAVARPDATVVVPLGLDLAPFAQSGGTRSLRSELGIDEHAIVFGFVGRLVPIKDVPALVTAFGRVLTLVRDAHLLIVGDGPERSAVERATAEIGVRDCVHLLGWREDLANLYATIDICVLSSRNEGTPVAVIEAMAAERPIVATRVGGVVDVVEHSTTGLLVPANDVAALSDAMARLARDPEMRARMGVRGRQAALARFGYERLVDEIDRLYRSAVAAKRAQPDVASIDAAV